MDAIATLSLALFIPVALAAFASTDARRAALIVMIGGILFLPMTGIKLPLIVVNKGSVTSLATFLGLIIFAPGPLLALRPKWVDLPMLIWCLVPAASSLSNGLGLYDGAWSVLNRSLLWGIPYVVGRAYFGDLPRVRMLAIALFVGGLVYVPFCLYEIKMSPQLHRMVYGTTVNAFTEAHRLGGWRPSVFMQHGLMVGLWMVSTGLIGLWLWYTGAVMRIAKYRTGPAVAWLLVTAVLCRSSGAIALLLIGAAILFRARTRMGWVLLAAVIFVVPTYVLARGSLTWSGEDFVDLVDQSLGAERADSIAFRFKNENLLAQHALKQPTFGWGGWKRARPQSETGSREGVTDGLWIIALGDNGVVGLSALTLALLLPAIRVARACPVSQWRNPQYAAPAALAVVTLMWAVDNLLNAMVNPLYVVAGGAIIALEARRGATAAGSNANPAVASRYEPKLVQRVSPRRRTRANWRQQQPPTPLRDKSSDHRGPGNATVDTPAKETRSDNAGGNGGT